VSAAPETTLPFDRVVVVEGRLQKEFTVAAFLELPLALRVGYVLGGGLEFFLGSTPVDRVTALGQLRVYHTARPARPGSS
jgi:hypothetical protein